MRIRAHLTRRASYAAVALAGLLAATTACGSSDGGSSSGGAAPTAAAAALGTPHPATGEPIVFGLATEGKSTTIDSSAAIPVAQAAVKYVNEYMGGIGGRPLELFVCEMHAAPAGASDCANQMIEKKVPAVLLDQSGLGQTLVPPIAAAGIPFFAWSGASAAESDTKGAYSVTGGIASLVGGLAGYAREHSIKEMGALAIDVPSVIQGMEKIGRPAFTKAGADLNLVSIPPGTADVTPQVQSAISGGAGALFFFGDKSLCAAGLKAAKTLGYTKPIFIVAQCVNPASVASVPGGYQGVLVTSVSDLADGSKEFELYRAVLTKYAPEVVEKSLRAGIDMQGYAVVIAFARAMEGLTGEITTATVGAKLASDVDIPAPLGADGQTFNCGTPPVSMFQSICSVGVETTVLDAAGQPTTYTPVNTDGLFN